MIPVFCTNLADRLYQSGETTYNLIPGIALVLALHTKHDGTLGGTEDVMA